VKTDLQTIQRHRRLTTADWQLHEANLPTNVTGGFQLVRTHTRLDRMSIEEKHVYNIFNMDYTQDGKAI
jgi:hypothetical protein